MIGGGWRRKESSRGRAWPIVGRSIAAHVIAVLLPVGHRGHRESDPFRVPGPSLAQPCLMLPSTAKLPLAFPSISRLTRLPVARAALSRRNIYLRSLPSTMPESKVVGVEDLATSEAK